MIDTAQRFNELKAGGLLPSPKGVALAVMELTNRANSGINEICQLVQADPAMSSRLLRYANSAAYGIPRKIASLRQAVTLLGLARVRQIALGFSLIDQYRSGHCGRFDYQAYWTSSLATAIAAQRLAPLAQCPPEESFTCGLLSSIGRLGLATAFPEDYAALLTKELVGLELASAERQLFGIDSAELSGELLASWGLPSIFATAVRNHQFLADTTFVPGSRAYALSSVLHLSMKIGSLLNEDDTTRWQQVPALYNAAAQAGLPGDELPGLLNEVVLAWQDWAKDLSLPTQASTDMRTLLSAPAPLPKSPSDDLRDRLPPSVAILIPDPALARQLITELNTLGVHCSTVTDPDCQSVDFSVPDAGVVIVDVGGSPLAAQQRFAHAKSQAGKFAQIIALIPDHAEALAESVIAAGAADYLPYQHSTYALIARLASAEHLRNLQEILRAEREVAVDSSREWARTNRRLLHEALTDPLTQLPNRRYGIDRLAQEWSISTSIALPLSCMMLDIDHFKKVNDHYGHDVGDKVLQQVARMIEASCRRNDVVFRYGGEEFCLICPGTDRSEALKLGQRIVDKVGSRDYGIGNQIFPVTLSIGVAARAPSTEGVEALIRLADLALYEAKRDGRNRVVAAIGAAALPTGEHDVD